MNSLHDRPELLRGIRVVDWLTYGSVRTEPDESALPQYLRTHFMCPSCGKSYMFAAEDVVQHRGLCEKQSRV